jgi:AbrB family looped-hinge helix DNA binding protein
MELATVTSKGQITIPVKIRNKLSLKTGDQVFFMEEKGKIVFQNASQIALSTIQKEMDGKAEEAGFKTEEDVVDYVKELRAKK